MALEGSNVENYRANPRDLFDEHFDATDFVNDQRRSFTPVSLDNSWRVSDRELCRRVIEDVIENMSGLLPGKDGMHKDITDKLRRLWFSKLNICDDDAVPKRDSFVNSESSSPSQTQVADRPDSLSEFKTPVRKEPEIFQLDGPNDTSDDDDEEENDVDDNDDDNDDEDDDNIIDEEDEAEDGDDGEPALGSEDDISDEDPSDLFNTENVVVCQFDKITRARNKWKFHLKDGIMNINGKDYVFQKATGDAEW